MKNFFNLEGPVMTFLTKATDLIILNLIYIICCIPIFTIGAATTALYYVTMKMVDNEEGYIVRDFFKSFKSNFRQATVIWLILFSTGLIALIEFLLVSRIEEGATIIMFLVAFQIMIWTFETLYVFPVLSRFENSIIATMKNAFLISLSHIPKTFLLILFSCIPVLLLLINLNLFPVVLFIGFSGVCYTNSAWMKKIFKKFEPQDNMDDDDFTVESSGYDNITDQDVSGININDGNMDSGRMNNEDHIEG